MMKKTMWVKIPMWVGLPIASVIVVGSQGAIAAPLTIGQNFTGLTFADGPIIPADSSGAVGRNHIVQMTNQGFAIYDKANGQVVQKTSLDSFWQGTGLPVANATNNFDPRVLYDPTSERWFTIAADRTDQSGNVQNFPLGNRVVFAVSNSADPTQGWHGFALPASDFSNRRFADAPTIGIDADGVHIAVNLFDAALNNQTSTLFAIAKPQLLNPTTRNLKYDRLFDVANADYGDSLQPVIDFTNPADGKADFLAASGGNQLRRSTLMGQKLGTQIIPTNNVRPAPYARQPDGSRTIETGDPRLSSSVVRVGNSIWLVQTTADTSGDHAVLRWSEIDAQTNEIKQSGEIADGKHDYFYPSIALNAFGNVVIGFNRSGADEYISSYAIGASTSGGKTTFGTPQLLKAGKDNYFNTFGFGRNRWGDSSATVFDPSDPRSFWTFQQVAERDNQWSTQISQIRFGASVQAPEPGVGLGLLGAIGMVGSMRRSGRR
jgi:hypothetical protein